MKGWVGPLTYICYKWEQLAALSIREISSICCTSLLILKFFTLLEIIEITFLLSHVMEDSLIL